VTTGYSDIIEQAKQECRDGCDIALEVCQAGKSIQSNTFILILFPINYLAL
jgi:hypothetical protein